MKDALIPGQWPGAEFTDSMLLFTAVLVALMAVQKLFSPKKTHRQIMLFVLFFFMAIVFGELSFIYSLPSLGYPPWAIYLLCTGFVTLSPVTWVYTNLLIHSDMQLTKRVWLHFLVPAGFFVGETLFFLYHIAQGTIQTRLETFYFDRSGDPLAFAFYAGFGLFTIYSFARFRMYYRLFDIQEIRMKLYLMTVLSTLALVAALAFTVGFMEDIRSLFQVAQVACAAITVTMFVSAGRVPDFFGPVTREIQKRKYEKSLIEGLNLNKLEHKLEELMKEARLYRQSDLSLDDVAGELSLSRYQLSEFLNQHLKVSFRHYVNRFRVAEAKRLLLDNPRQDVLSICYFVGFNSKSSFNDAFKRNTGRSPSEFRSTGHV